MYCKKVVIETGDNYNLYHYNPVDKGTVVYSPIDRIQEDRQEKSGAQQTNFRTNQSKDVMNGLTKGKHLAVGYKRPKAVCIRIQSATK